MRISGLSAAARVAALTLSAVFFLPLAGGPGLAQDAPLIPERRLILSADTDLPGGDLAQIFDIPLNSCLEACLSDPDCDSVTYNQRSRACFPKSGQPAPMFFEGALSGHVALAGHRVDIARDRAAQAGFLTSADLHAALQQARQAAANWLPQGSVDPRGSALALERDGKWQDAITAFATVVAESDHGDDWVTLARIANAAGERQLAASAAVNGWLRAEADATGAQALKQLSEAWGWSRSRDALAALRLAGRIDSAPDIREALEQAEERWGMRVSDHEVESDRARPAICVDFTRDLSPDMDYSPYLRLPTGDLTVEATGSQLCVAGLRHGETVSLLLRAGLPSGDGEALTRDVELTAYVRDRNPTIRFPGRAYVLPATGDRGLEVATVNADTASLRLLRVSDRNLIATLRDDLFARPLDYWSARWLDEEMATEIWTGEADLAADPVASLNQEVTTRLGIPDAAGPLAPGVYVLEARLPGADGAEFDYNDDAVPVAVQWFLVSDLGISSLWGSDSLTVVVRGLSDAGARVGIEIALVSRANAVLAVTETDDQGVARFDGAIARGQGGAAPAMITVTDWQGQGDARQPADMAFLSLLDPEFDLSDRGVAGLAAPGPIDLFMTSDRGVYRAGETVHVTALARDSTAQAIHDLPLSAVFIRPDGVEAKRLRIQPDAAGGYVFDLPIDNQAMRGTWRLDMRAEDKGPPLASTRLLVEDFLPERIDFSLDLPSGPLTGDSVVEVTGTARWLFGAPAASMPFEAWLGLAPTHALPGFDNFTFGVPDDRTPRLDNIAAGETGPDGGFAYTASLPEVSTVTEATLRTEVREGAGRPVERRETRIILPDQPITGIRPLFQGDTVAEGSDARFEVIAVGPDLSRRALPARWTLTRLETEYVWYRAGNRWDWEAVTHRRRMDTGSIQIPSDMPAALSLPVEWGQYELRIEAQDGSGASAITFWSGWATAGSGVESPDRLSLRLDQPAYRAGDTARLTIEAEEDGIAIVSVLTNRVVDLTTVPLVKGANEVTLPVTDEWGGGAYVTAAALRRLDGDGTSPNRAPLRRLGLAYAPVDPGARKLEARIETAARSRPRDTLPVTLHLDGLEAGQTAQATIAVVDQGILNLTGFKSPDPQGHYFGQHRLGVGLRDLYGRLLLSTGAPDGALREGGDAQTGLDTAAPPPTEVLMAWFSGPVTVGQDGTISVEVPIPDFNGEVRVMAVAWTDSAIGQAEATAQIRDPVVLMVTAPQFLAPGDSTSLQLELTQTEGAGETALALDLPPGQLTATGRLPDSVTLAEGAVARLTLPISVPADAPTGTAQLQFALTAPDGSLLTKDISIPIIDTTPETLRRTRLSLSAGQAVELDGSDSAGLQNISRIMLTAGPFASLDIGSVLGDLARYPYGCTEQIASAALPLIHMPRLMASVLPEGEHPDTADTVRQTVTRILARQNADGGFGMWRTSDDGDTWLDAYATGFLAQARAAGYAVPERAWQAALSNLRNRVNYALSPTAGDRWENASLAQAVLVLARERAAAIGDLRYYADAAGDEFATPLSAAQIGAALALYGDEARGQRMLDRALAQLDRASGTKGEIRWDYGSDLRDRAMVLALAIEAGLNVPDLDARIRQLASRIDQQRSQSGLSTQDSAALVELAQALRGAVPGLRIDGRPITEVITPLIAGRDVALAAGGAPVDVTLTAFGRLARPDPAGGIGYQINRNYFDMDGSPVDITQIALGTRLAVLVEITPDPGNPGGRLIIDDPLPAGFEIDNPDLIEAGSDAALSFGDTVEPDMAQFLRERFIASTVWTQDDTLRLVYIVRAVHAGEFAHPAATLTDMYRPQFRAWTDAGRVTITD